MSRRSTIEKTQTKACAVIFVIQWRAMPKFFTLSHEFRTHSLVPLSHPAQPYLLQETTNQHRPYLYPPSPSLSSLRTLNQVQRSWAVAKREVRVKPGGRCWPDATLKPTRVKPGWRLPSADSEARRAAPRCDLNLNLGRRRPRANSTSASGDQCDLDLGRRRPGVNSTSTGDDRTRTQPRQATT